MFSAGNKVTPAVHIKSTPALLLDALAAGMEYGALTSLAVPFPGWDEDPVPGRVQKEPVPHAVCAMLMQPTRLRELDLQGRPSLWLRLLPCMKGLQHLRSLGLVPLWEAEVLRHVGALTRLTGLWGDCGEWLEHAEFSLLATLTALKALSLRNGPNTDCKLGAFATVRPEELCSRAVWPVGSYLHALLAVLPQLDAIQVMPEAGTDLYTFECVLKSPKSGSGPPQLRHLSLLCDEPPCGGFPLPACLEHLCIGLDSQSCPELMRSVQLLTRLTTLRIWVLDWCGPDMLYNAAWGVGTFLTGLTGLARLELMHVLHVANVATDVHCLARLTRLTSLGLLGHCGGQSLTLPVSRSWRRPCAASGSALCGLGRRPKRDALSSFVKRVGEVHRLTRLRQLGVLCLEYPWSCGWERSNVEVMNAGRRELGLEQPITMLWAANHWAEHVLWEYDFRAAVASSF